MCLVALPHELLNIYLPACLPAHLPGFNQYDYVNSCRSTEQLPDRYIIGCNLAYWLAAFVWHLQSQSPPLGCPVQLALGPEVMNSQTASDRTGGQRYAISKYSEGILGTSMVHGSPVHISNEQFHILCFCWVFDLLGQAYCCRWATFNVNIPVSVLCVPNIE